MDKTLVIDGLRHTKLGVVSKCFERKIDAIYINATTFSDNNKEEKEKILEHINLDEIDKVLVLSQNWNGSIPWYVKEILDSFEYLAFEDKKCSFAYVYSSNSGEPIILTAMINILFAMRMSLELTFNLTKKEDITIFKRAYDI